MNYQEPETYSTKRKFVELFSNNKKFIVLFNANEGLCISLDCNGTEFILYSVKKEFFNGRYVWIKAPAQSDVLLVQPSQVIEHSVKEDFNNKIAKEEKAESKSY